MRRHLEIAAILATILAAVSAPVPAKAQTTPPSVSFTNPPAIGEPRGYSHVVEVTGPGRTIYIAGQLGYDRSGKVPAPGDFRAQATQVFENLKAALQSTCTSFKDITKLNTFLTDIRAQIPIYREVRDKYVNAAAPPASTTVEVSRLAREGALIEVEAIAVAPARPSTGCP
ncbi:MAG: RidA family protein [Hyphomicrobiales bacterium]|nr:RidA family protein [Hyphomicrobiales bacterium]